MRARVGKQLWLIYFKLPDLVAMRCQESLTSCGEVQLSASCPSLIPSTIHSNPLRCIKHFLNMNPLEDPQLVNPSSQLPANDGFFRNANGLSFNQATFMEIWPSVILVNGGLTYVESSWSQPKNWLQSSGIHIDGSISISKHYDSYATVPRALWPWKWSRWFWPSPALKCIASTPTIGKMFLRIIWNLSNHRVFCFPGVPFHEFWHIL